MSKSDMEKQTRGKLLTFTWCQDDEAGAREQQCQSVAVH